MFLNQQEVSPSITADPGKGTASKETAKTAGKGSKQPRPPTSKVALTHAELEAFLEASDSEDDDPGEGTSTGLVTAKSKGKGKGKGSGRDGTEILTGTQCSHGCDCLRKNPTEIRNSCTDKTTHRGVVLACKF